MFRYVSTDFKSEGETKSRHIADNRFLFHFFPPNVFDRFRAVSDTAGLQANAAFPSFGDNKAVLTFISAATALLSYCKSSSLMCLSKSCKHLSPYVCSSASSSASNVLAWMVSAVGLSPGRFLHGVHHSHEGMLPGGSASSSCPRRQSMANLGGFSSLTSPIEAYCATFREGHPC